MSKYTPTPWHREDTADYANIVSEDKSLPAMVALPDDADFIVTAVNSHDALVSALKNAQAAFPCEMYADALKLAGELEEKG
jgi:hypothetical protein